MEKIFEDSLFEQITAINKAVMDAYRAGAEAEREINNRLKRLEDEQKSPERFEIENPERIETKENVNQNERD